MSALARLLEPRAAAITTPADLLRHVLRTGDTDSGAVVTVESAMRVAAVYSCVRVLSEDLAKLPLIVYRRRKDGGKDRASNHWLQRLLNVAPNPWQTAFEFREMMQAQVDLCGNAFALKTIVREEVRELLPVPAWRVTVEQRRDWTIGYALELPSGERVPVPGERMFHLPGLSLDGIEGLSPIGYQREIIGLAMQLTKHGARLFKNGAQLGGVLEHPSKLSKDAAQRLRESFDEKYASADNAWKTVLLEEGMKFSKTAMTSEDSQFLDTQKYSRSQIAGAYRVPPHKIGDLERATFSNIEQQETAYVADALLPRSRRWESRVVRSLVPEREQATVFAEHLFEGLLRGDTQTRYTAYGQAIKDGWMTRNEARERENLNRADGLDEFLEPLNMAPAGSRDDAGGSDKEER